MAKNKSCSDCEYFSHALEAMTDHVNYHSCIFYDKKIISVTIDGKSCKHFKRKSK